MDKNIQKIGLVNLVAMLLLGAFSAWVSRRAESATGMVSVVFMGSGFLVAAISYFQMRLADREYLETLELEGLRKGPAGSALFENKDAELFPARRAREQFSKYFVPVFTFFLVAIQGAAGVWFWRYFKNAAPPAMDQALVVAAFSGIFSLFFFLLGRYSAGVSRIEGQRLLQPAASYLLLGSVTSVVVVISEAVVYFLNYPRIDMILARILCVILMVVAVEGFLNLIMEIYRPRLRGQAERLLYESRLIGLLGRPGGLITTAAQALDYQFGFKVSETWFYRFMERTLAWLVLAQLGLLFVSSTVVVVGPSEQGLLERYGVPVAGREVLEPGLHLKYPWPIDKVYLYPVRELQTFHIGFEEDPSRAQERVIVWTRQHFKEEANFLVASGEATTTNATTGEKNVPVNLLAVNIPVQYRIRDIKAWARTNENSADLLQNIAQRVVVRKLVNVDIDDLMKTNRLEAAVQLREEIQKQADEYKMGAEIVFVGLEGIHPPVKVADAYEAVVGALQTRESTILEAKAYQAQKLPAAIAEATNIVSRALSAGLTKELTAQAQSQQFKYQLEAYEASPSVYRQKAYLETMANAVAGVRKYVLAASNTQEVIWFNLEDKLSKDLFDVTFKDKK